MSNTPSTKRLLRKAEADLEFLDQVQVHANEMVSQVSVNMPSDVADNVAAYVDAVHELRRALNTWARALEQAIYADEGIIADMPF
jgi:hypothetical protein